MLLSKASWTDTIYQRLPRVTEGFAVAKRKGT